MRSLTATASPCVVVLANVLGANKLRTMTMILLPMMSVPAVCAVR
jgi:ABC-type sulfate transport system permease component